MGRNTEIFMFHKGNASNSLYKALKDNRLYKKTFKEFVKERTQGFGGNSNEIFENILSVVKKDINTISPNYLFEVVYYLEEELKYGKYGDSGLHWKLDAGLRSKNEQAVNDIFEMHGINLLYEVHTSTACYSYMFQFGNFAAFFPIKENYDNGYNLSSKDFLMFNDYMILIMNKIIKSGLLDYDNNDLDLKSIEIDHVLQKYQTNQIMHQCIEKEFDWLKSCMSKDDKIYKAEKHTLYSAELFLSQSLEMKLKINPKINHRIVIVDSI